LGTVVNEGPMLTVNAATVIRSEADLHKEMICLVNPRDFILVFIKLVSFFNRFLLALMPLVFVQNQSKRKRFQFSISTPPHLTMFPYITTLSTG